MCEIMRFFKMTFFAKMAPYEMMCVQFFSKKF